MANQTAQSPADLKNLFSDPKHGPTANPDPDLSGLEEKVSNLAQKTQKADTQKLKELQESIQEEESLTQFNDKLDRQNPQLVGDHNKERLTSSHSGETIKYQERSTEFEPNEQVGDFIKSTPNVDKISLPEPVIDDFGEIILEASRVPKPNITLPLDQEELDQALHKKVANSILWLAKWCQRNILLAPKRVFFPDKKKTPENKK